MADPLFAVADGMGGPAAGEVASDIAVSSARQGVRASTARPPQTTWSRRPRPPTGRCGSRPRPPGDARAWAPPSSRWPSTESGQHGRRSTSATRACTFPRRRAPPGHVDHNLVAELVLEGRLTQEEAEVHPAAQRHHQGPRRRSGGGGRPVRGGPRAGDRFLLCSDGLPREVSDDFIAVDAPPARRPRGGRRSPGRRRHATGAATTTSPSWWSTSSMPTTPTKAPPDATLALSRQRTGGAGRGPDRN